MVLQYLISANNYLLNCFCSVLISLWMCKMPGGVAWYLNCLHSTFLFTTECHCRLLHSSLSSTCHRSVFNQLTFPIFFHLFQLVFLDTCLRNWLESGRTLLILTQLVQLVFEIGKVCQPWVVVLLLFNTVALLYSLELHVMHLTYIWIKQDYLDGRFKLGS